MSAPEKIFGIHAVASLLQRQADRIARLMVQAGRQDKRLQELLAAAEKAGVTVEVCSRAAMDQLVDGRHQGVIAEVQAAPLAYTEAELPALLEAAGKRALLLVLDGVTDPHNLGACLRSADAAGVTAVIAPRDNASGLTPVVRKIACGAAETVPFIQVTNLARSLRALQQQGLWLVGLAGEAEQLLYDVDLRGPVVLVMGAEGRGLRRLTRECCDYLAKLPMAGSVDSLNVSVATGVGLFEAVRQRRD